MKSGGTRSINGLRGRSVRSPAFSRFGSIEPGADPCISYGRACEPDLGSDERTLNGGCGNTSDCAFRAIPSVRWAFAHRLRMLATIRRSPFEEQSACSPAEWSSSITLFAHLMSHAWLLMRSSKWRAERSADPARSRNLQGWMRRGLTLGSSGDSDAT